MCASVYFQELCYTTMLENNHINMIFLLHAMNIQTWTRGSSDFQIYGIDIIYE